ncbi:LytR family transcriptional regulator [Rhodococcus sp. WMMA185]|uniref:LCP family protein n=1 Tax=Rhodococcus sp. WMMA185 TaxID=679318 RepID=UPI0008785DD1|nr:LCP family protein [Rhodococcus sp. WMMA185]AOW92211.1 LytR family transcriptional regulator [Rhodococcus sp. WMMA185]
MPRRPLHIAVTVLSVLALIVTGFAWWGIDSLRNNLAIAAGLELGGDSDGAIDILIVGTDSRTDAHGNPLSQAELDLLRAGEEVASNTDTIVLIRIPVDGSSATAISIPRDSYVKVPGIGMSKINAAYGATKETRRLELVENGATADEAEEKATKAGREALITSVADLTGVTVDRYAEVGMLGFILLTDAVGGVDVCLENPVDEPLSGAHFPAGTQTLTGADALSFVRQRHGLPRGDHDRIVRQQVFMASLVDKVLSGKTLRNPRKLDNLTTAVERSVVLDDDWDIIEFATQLQDLAGGDVRFETIPVADLNDMTDYGESVVRVKPREVQEHVAALVGREIEDPEDSKTSEPSDIDPSAVTVDVSNAGDVSGLARGVADALDSIGYKRGEVGNHTGDWVNETTVFTRSSDDAAAEAVAAALGGLRTDTDSTLPKGSVHVVLTSDYRGPSSAESINDRSDESGDDGLESVFSSGTGPTPVQPGPPIDAGSAGPRCVN